MHAAAQIAQEGASKEIDKYLSTFSFPSEESKKLTKVALLNYCGAAILMPYKFFHTECKKLKYDLELLQNTFATSFEQVSAQSYLLARSKASRYTFSFFKSRYGWKYFKKIFTYLELIFLDMVEHVQDGMFIQH